MRVLYCINRIQIRVGVDSQDAQVEMQCVTRGDSSLDEPIRAGIHHVTAGGKALGKPGFSSRGPLTGPEHISTASSYICANSLMFELFCE